MKRKKTESTGTLDLEHRDTGDAEQCRLARSVGERSRFCPDVAAVTRWQVHKGKE